VTLDQRVNGGEWVALGSYAMTPGQNHRVVLTDQGSGTWVTADALRLVRESATAAGGEIVIDNLDPGASGDSGWVVNTYTGGGRFWGSNVFMNDPGTPAEVFTWTPSLPAAQRYRVYARWTQDPNRATDAPYTVHHDGGATTVTVNQEVNGGLWVALGTYALSPGSNHRVALSDAANGRVIADAVKLVPDGNARAVVADAMRFVPAETPVFAAASSSLLDETIYLNGRPLAQVEGGALAYVHTDHLGTPQKMTDSTGALVWDAVFRPFGEAESITGSASNDLRFPGQLYDAETGLHYNYFRDYDPSLGRYVQSDPIGLRGGVNRYGYSFGNPIVLADPFGLEVQVEVGVGGMMGVALFPPTMTGIGVSGSVTVGISTDGSLSGTQIYVRGQVNPMITGGPGYVGGGGQITAGYTNCPLPVGAAPIWPPPLHVEGNVGAGPSVGAAVDASNSGASGSIGGRAGAGIGIIGGVGVGIGGTIASPPIGDILNPEPGSEGASAGNGCECETQ
jgi:RHS repeat-associated protein